MNFSIKNGLYRYLDSVGDGSGDKTVVGDYSGTAKRFLIKPPAGENYILNRVIIHVVDGGSFDSGSYGNGITLTNGITIDSQDKAGSRLIDYLDNAPIKTNVDWGRICYDINISKFGSGNEALDSRWTFSKSGRPIVLNGDNEESFGMTFNDNFTGLVEQRFLIQGYIVKT